MAEELKDRLQQALALKSMTQAQLASTLEVTPAAVSAWCSGKVPGVRTLTRIAEALGVSPSYLLGFNDSDAPAADLSVEREAYRQTLQWYWRPAPSDGGRELGNAAEFAFPLNMATLARETAQNSSDERATGEKTVDMRFSVIELSGTNLKQFLAAMKFKNVRDHLEAASGSTQKVARVIKDGLDRLDQTGRLILLRIEDSHANGLMGPEYESGRYMAVVRNILDSFKGAREGTAGGSYGLGKSTMWASSRFGLVLINSTLAEPEGGKREGRFISRIELPWHTIGDDAFAGPGWFGEPDPNKADKPTRSYWGNRAVLQDLLLERSTVHSGTSFLIVGAYDPSDEAETVEEIAEALRRGLAEHFWPAMVEGDEDETDDEHALLTAVVRAEKNGREILEQFVDPDEHQPAKVRAYRKHLSDEVVDTLEKAGDLVRRSVRLRIPKRTAEGTSHPQQEHEAVLLVVQAEDNDDTAGTVSYLRGSHMIVKRRQLTALPVGARPFHAIVLAGEAAGAEAADRAAERFLRAAEPPAHNDWTATPDLTANYARGGRTYIQEFEREIGRLVREIVKQPAKDLSDGPDALKELLRLAPPRPETEKKPRVRQASGQPAGDGAWEIEAVVSLPERDRTWSLAPVLKFGTESGAAIPVRWRELKAISKCEISDGRLVTKRGARTIKFAGVTDPTSHPVSSAFAKVLVDIRANAEEAAV